MKLSDQAMGAIMMALQKSLLEQSDIVPTLKSFQFQVDKNQNLIVENPPSFAMPGTSTGSDLVEERNKAIGSD